MNILTINCVRGIYSTGRIIASIEEYTKAYGCEYFHCYEFGAKSKGKAEYRISGPLEYRVSYWMSKLLGWQYGSGTLATIRLCRVIYKWNPDVVHIHCPNAKSVNLYYLLNYLKKNHYITVITNHAEFFYTGNCAHAFECTGYLRGCKGCKDYRLQTDSLFFNNAEKAWKKMKLAFEQFERLMMVAVSPWAEYRITSSEIAKDIPTVVIKNGIDTNVFFHIQKFDKLIEDYHSQKVILHVTSNFSDRLDDAKGGVYVLQLAKKLKEYTIIVVGPSEVEKENVPSNVKVIGKIDDPDVLAQYYSMADLTVLTSKRETYGLTCAESMCCGTPVVGFINGGTETVALSQYSEFVEYGDVKALCDAVEKWIQKKDHIKTRLEQEAIAEYSDYKMAMNYLELYQKLLKKYQED